jgi:hypothetical protein
LSSGTTTPDCVTCSTPLSWGLSFGTHIVEVRSVAVTAAGHDSLRIVVSEAHRLPDPVPGLTAGSVGVADCRSARTSLRRRP